MRSIVGVELGQDVRYAAFDSGFAYRELSRNLLVRVACGNQRQDFNLPFR